MIDPASDLPQDPPVRRLSGATRVGLAFVAGTLFALLPMYYFYAGNSGSPQREPVGSPGTELEFAL